MTARVDSMVSLPIPGDPVLVGVLLVRVMAHFDADATHAAAPAVESQAIAALRSLSPLEAWRLGGMRHTGLSLVVDTRQLTENLRALKRITAEAETIAYFVRHGASRTMLHSLFHISHEVVSRQRRRLGIRLGKGRPRLPEEGVRDAIHRTWVRICRDQCDARERLVQLHSQFPEYSLVALNAVLNEFAEP